MFDRLFTRILFEETEGELLFVEAKEHTANKIEENSQSRVGKELDRIIDEHLKRVTA